MKTPTLLTPPFQILSNTPPLFCCFVSLAEYWTTTSHLMCFFSKYYRLKLVKSLLCIPCNKASILLKVWHKWHDFCWYSDLQPYTEINTNRTQGRVEWHTLKMYNNTTCYVHKVATYITMNEWLADVKMHFTKVHNVFAIQKLLPCRSHISAD